ncbi:MAG: hypothetical protein HY260_23625 [Chloroflexi bacterium]|nr:hypothetical protein [Chloroflexota bacterium]
MKSVRRVVVVATCLALFALACGSGALIATVSSPSTAKSTARPRPTEIAPPTAITLPTVTPGVEVDISGNYTVFGTNLSGAGYSGKATITRTTSGYSVRWTFGSEIESGTGTLVADTLSVRWQTSDGKRSGTATYTLQPDGTLSGTWTQDGVTGEGTETLTPVK